jgi:hypothetical protein
MHYNTFITKAWDDYMDLFLKHSVDKTSYGEWPKIVQDAYENWQYQHELNALCEIDLSVVGTKYASA